MRIGLDLGGTKIAGGMVDDKGTVIVRRKIPTDKSGGYGSVAKGIVALVNDIIEESGVRKGDVERIGIAAAGQIEKNTGRVVFSPNLPGFHYAPLREDVENTLGIKTSIENDVNAATFGEWKFGLGERPSDVIGVFVGTGIGGGIIIDKKVYRGFSNVGGEIGHMTLNPHGYRCNCGNTGCFEAYCGGSYIAERVKSKVREGYDGKIRSLIKGDVNVINAGLIETASLEGDEYCRLIWEEVVEYMGAGLASLVNMFNPEIIILGGGVVYGTKNFMDRAVEVMKKRAMVASVEGLHVEKAKLGEDAAILGAAFVET